MAKLKHSEVAAKLAIEGIVAGLAGTVKGQLGITPKPIVGAERADLGLADVGDTLFYPVGESGVFLHADGPFTTIWYGGADCASAITGFDAALKRNQPKAKQVSDNPHKSEAGFNQRTYDVQLANDKLAVVEAIYPVGRVENPKFMVRVTAFNKKK